MRPVALGVLSWFACSIAAAQSDGVETSFDVQLWYPAPGVGNFFSVESGDVNPHLEFNVGLALNAALRPLSIRIKQGDGTEQDIGEPIGFRFDANLYGAIGFLEWIDLGLVMPLTVQSGDDQATFESVGIKVGDLQSFTQGDLRVVPKVRILNLSSGALSIAVVGTVVLPTADKTAFSSEKGVMVAPSLALSSRLGGWRLGFNGGYRFRDRTRFQTLTIDDEIFVKGAVGYRVDMVTPLEIIVELFGHTPANKPLGLGVKAENRDAQDARTSLEIDVGARLTLLESIKVFVLAGTGLRPGYGSPLARATAGVAFFTAEAGPRDEDGDLVADADDQCPNRREDRDGFEDEDGCPELDNDRDTVLDEDDNCPLEPEDRDGFEDDDGCPEPDNDNDGFLDADDPCPVEAEDKDGFEDDNGCPDLDNDGDQVADAVDQCPMEPEDKDGFKDEDGCPEPDNDLDGLADLNDLCPNHPEDKDGVVDDDGCPEDNDGDGIPDDQDKCINEAEVYNGIEDEDGCPEKLRVKSLVSVTEDKIEIKEKVFFRSGSEQILPKSFKLLDQVASVLKNYQHLKKIQIEGHSDNRGSKRRNQRLSQRRAESVRQYLVDKGIEPERLVALGIGPSRPIASNRSRRGREQNRRVEFVILEQTPIGKDVSQPDVPPPPPGETGIEFEFGDPAAPGSESDAEPPKPPATGGQTEPETEAEPEAEDGIQFDF